MAEYICTRCKNVKPCEYNTNEKNVLSGHPEYCPLSADYYPQWERIDIASQARRAIHVDFDVGLKQTC